MAPAENTLSLTETFTLQIAIYLLTSKIS